MQPTLHERRRRIHRLIVGVVVALGLLLVTVIDRRAYWALRIEDWDSWKGRDWVQFLRTMGYLPTWIAVGVAVGLAGLGPRSRPVVTRLAWMIPASAAAGGALAELLKVIVTRHRPSLSNTGLYFYDWFDAPWPGRGLGLASSHAGAAFGAAFLLWRFSPRVGVFVTLLACGCVLTRLLAGAHFVSDAYVAAVLAYVASGWIWKLGRGEAVGTPSGRLR